MSTANLATAPLFEQKSIFACAPQTTRGQPVHLGGDPKGQNVLYTNGRTVIIRNLANPAISQEYTGHAFPVTAARYAPSGYYIASSDERGNVRIWDCTQKTQLLKSEFRVLSGKINDLCWDSESKRIIAVGDGREKFGHAFTFDSGNSVGEISGHNKVINAVSIRNIRPFRAVTCSDDMSLVFYHGPPFKFNRTLNLHTRFVQCVRYAPSGSHFISVGMDGKIFLYDGLTADKVSELSATDNTHTGGLYSVSWSPDSKFCMTSSADMTVKVWDVEKSAVVNTFSFSDSPTVEHQQVGTLWQDKFMISLSLNGNLNYLDQKSGKVAKIVQGHQKSITAFSRIPDSNKLYTGSYDGRVYAWETATGEANLVSGSGHTNQVSGLSHDQGQLLSIGMDDTLRSIDVAKNEFTSTALPTEAVPKSIFSTNKTSVITTVSKILLVQNGAIVSSIDNPDGTIANACAINKDQTEVVLACQDMKVRLFNIKGNPLTLTVSESSASVPAIFRSALSAVSYSPDGKYLAVGDAAGKIQVLDAKTKEAVISYWVYHTGRINSIVWSNDSLHAVSASLDTNIYVWSVERPSKHLAIKGAHQESVTGAQFLDPMTIASVGNDACIKIWKLTSLP